jgi:intracellular multiplication protein IcmT
MIDRTTHWRDSSRRPRFFFLDAQVIYPLLIFLFNISYTTLKLLIIALLFYTALEKFGFTVYKLFRYLKIVLAGTMKYRRGWWQ